MLFLNFYYFLGREFLNSCEAELYIYENFQAQKRENKMGLKIMQYFAILLFCSSIAVGQYELDKRKYVKKLNVGFLYNLDTSNYLDKTEIGAADSIECISFHNFCWFAFLNKISDKIIYGKLLALNENDNSLHSVTDSLVKMYSVRRTIGYFDIFNDRLFIMRMYGNNPEEGDVGGLRISLIDPDKIEIVKEIYLEKDAWFNSIYEKNDTLLIEVQPMKAELNFWHYLVFWWPRNVPPKWDYVRNGDKICYTIDKSFNIIRKEFIKVNRSKWDGVENRTN
ncbi:MAG: hypothetical protein ACM3QX_11805 [Syntrophomonadaceae bacterium]